LSTAALEMHGVSAFGDAGERPMLAKVDWTVGRGEHWALVGANGAGKSTLLKVAAGMLEPDEGTVRALGEPFDTHGLANPKLRIGVIESHPRTYAENLTVLEIVSMQRTGPAAVMGARIDPTERERAAALLERFGCGHLASRRYRVCSQGERQRVMLARAMMRDPELLLLDEPSSALDLIAREACLEAVSALVAGAPRIATVTVAHHLEELPAVVDHAVLLREGRVLAAGPVAAVLSTENLSRAFAAPVEVRHGSGRWRADLAASPR
jgi:iron complex transport system ATP-binding protein